MLIYDATTPPAGGELVNSYREAITRDQPMRPESRDMPPATQPLSPALFFRGHEAKLAQAIDDRLGLTFAGRAVVRAGGEKLDERALRVVRIDPFTHHPPRRGRDGTAGGLPGSANAETS